MKSNKAVPADDILKEIQIEVQRLLNLRSFYRNKTLTVV